MSKWFQVARTEHASKLFMAGHIKPGDCKKRFFVEPLRSWRSSGMYTRVMQLRRAESRDEYGPPGRKRRAALAAKRDGTLDLCRQN